jgi:membrane associated rhomboid family serine protease
MSFNRQNRFAYDVGWTEIVRFLILSNVTIFAVQAFFPDTVGVLFRQYFALVPAALFQGRIWQIFTYMFLHGGLGHLFFNMLALFMFGSVLEREWGSREFLKYYLLTGVAGGLSYALFNYGSFVPTVGASGAIYGLLVAYAVLFPNNVIYVWFVIPLKAKWFAIIFGVIEFLASFSSGSQVAHLAHLGGMAVGYIYLKRHRFVRNTFGGMREWKERREEEQRRREEQSLDDIRREVDELLDKINRVGMGGLTKAEQKRLEKASRMLRGREREKQT